jgi:AcrR family transcriptional regulator
MEQNNMNRTDRKKEDTLKKIVTTTVDLINQYGFETVTMEQIAGAADIAKGTLYHYFPSKESIINTYLQRTFQERNNERIAQLRQLPDTRSRLTQVFTMLIEGVQRQKQIFEIFLVYRMKHVISLQPVEEGQQSGLNLLIREIITMGIQSKELRTDLPEDILEGMVEFSLIEAIKPLYLQPESYDAQLSINQCVDLFLNGTKA